MLQSHRGSRVHPFAIALFTVLGAAYLLLVGLAIAILPPAFALIFGVLPLPFLLTNRIFDFPAPERLLRSSFALSIVLFLLWPRYLSFNFGGPDLVPARLLYGLLLVTWFGALASPSFRKATLKTFSDRRGWLALLAAYFLIRLASVVGSEAFGLSAYQVANELLTAGLIVPIFYSVFNTNANIQKLLWSIVLAGAIIGVLTVVERALGRTLFANVRLPGMTVDSEWLYAAIMEKSRGGSYRAQGTFSHPLLLAEFSAFALPICLYFCAVAKGVRRILSALAVLLVIIAGALSGSRAAFAALPIGLVMCATILMCRQWLVNRQLGVASVILSLSFVVGIFGIALLWLTGTIDSSLVSGRTYAEASSTNTRLDMLARGIPKILEHPFLGYGPGLSAYIAGVKNSIALTIDSYYLSLAIDSGLLGLGVFALLFIGALLFGLKRAISSSDDFDLMRGMVAVSLLGMLLVKAILSTPHNAPLMLLGLALITAVPKNSVPVRGDNQ
ncbi:O-antigen ligase family protein [Aquincola sp. MAHUQ-54]|uniref:O-antigen ligase family protein n=1 Tax=Aquincola agrisoli TaxID=3119538 RepID=A0AAW9QGR6_9BURK